MDKFTFKTILVSIILGCILGIVCVIVYANHDQPVLKEFQSDYSSLIDSAKEDQNGYFYADKEKYLIEVFPIGKTDYALASEVSEIPDTTRLVKVSWYNKARTRIEHYYYNEVNYMK